MERRANRRILTVSFLIMSLIVSPAWGANIVWDGSEADNSSNTALNWVGDTAPLVGAADTMQFGVDTGPADYAVTIDLNYTLLTGIDFVAGAAQAYTVSNGAGTLTFGAGATIFNNDTAFDHQFTNGMTFGAGAIFNTLNLTNDLTVDGIIAGTDITKNGAGILTLNNANTFTGMTLNAGTIVLGNVDALGGVGGSLSLTGDGSLDAGGILSVVTGIDLAANKLTFVGSNALTLSGVIAGAGGGSLDVTTGTLTLSGNNSFTGGVTLNGASTLTVGHNNALGVGGTFTVGAGGASTIETSGGTRTISNLLVLDNTLTFLGAADDLTLSGNISGAGGLTKSGAASLTLSGADNSAYSGAVTLNAGTLILGDDDALGTGTFTVGGAANLDTSSALTVANTMTLNNTLTLDGTSDLILSGILSGAGGLTKDGTGTLTLSAVNTFDGATTLAAGTLNGVFTVDALNQTGGTLAPGNSIGTVTIAAGNYTLGAGGTLEVEVENAAGGLDSDLVDVTSGSATLAAGSTISVVDISTGGFIIRTGDQFTIIRTTGGVTDSGATIMDNSAVLSFAGSVVGTNYILEAARISSFSDAVTGGNNKRTMAAIDSDEAVATGDYATIIAALQGLNTAQLNDAADDLNPVPHASASMLSVVTTQQMASGMSNYLGARRMGTEQARMADLRSPNSNLLLADASDNPHLLAMVIKENSDRQEKQDGDIRGFLRPFGVFYKQNGTKELTGFSAQAVGTQFGFDRNRGQNLILGIGGGYSHSFIDFDNNRGDGDVDSFRLGPYATYYNDDYYIDGSVTFGYHNIKNERDIAFGAINRTAKSDYDAYDLSVYVGGGYDIESDNWTLSPNTSLQYINYHSEEFKESGAGAAGLKVSARTSESLRSKLGLNVSRIFDVGERKIATELFCGWAHEFMDEENVGANFVDGTAKFTNDIDSDRDDSVYYGVGLSTLIKENVSAYIRYEGETSSGNNINALNVGITILF